MSESFFSFLSVLPAFPVSLLDIVMIGILAFYAWEGYKVGFAQSIIDLAGFFVAFLLALKGYGIVAIGLIKLFTLPVGFANAIGFFICALTLEVLITLLLRRLTRYLPLIPKDTKIGKGLFVLNQYAGIVPGVISAGIILSFLVSVLIALPSSPVLKQAVSSSKIGGFLLSNTSGIEKGLNSIFGEAFHDSLNFFTVEPESSTAVELHFKVMDGVIDEESEKKMLEMVNQEREKHNLQPVTLNKSLRQLAREYSDNMFKDGYFSHYDREGNSPFDRMDQKDIAYSYAGENLALAPTVELAMQGLMNSPGHRANILKPEFKKLGVGVVDGGIYGKMFTQEFTD